MAIPHTAEYTDNGGKKNSGVISVINKAMIDKMLSLPDDKMLMMLRIVMSGAGADLPAGKLDASAAAKIRAVLGEVTEADIERVTYLAGRYRNGGRNGK